MLVVGKRWPSKLAIEERVRDLDTNIVLSWGSVYSGALNGMPRVEGVEQLKRLRAGGALVPDFTANPHEAVQWAFDGVTVLGRRSNHSQGRDIKVLNATSIARNLRLRHSEYWVKAIRNVAQEWRIHAFKGRYIAQGLKVDYSAAQLDIPIRSRRNGWRIDHGTMPPPSVKSAAVLAVTALGYDFGAVDILVTQDGTIYVLEVNKAPGLDNYSASRYERAIRRYVAEQA